MEKITQIFIQLGADQSFFYQFVIFIVLFVLLKFVLFNKLLFVLQTRENKTTKMEELANNKFGEADKLSKKFEEEISKTRTEEIEKAAQLGLGLKKPLFETAKEIGIKNIVDELNRLADEHGEFYRPDPLLVSMQ